MSAYSSGSASSRAGSAAIVGGAAMFLSGCSALTFQVLWTRQLTLIVGAEIYSITVAVSAFFAGLAAGGVVFGRYADRIGRPLRLYAALEFGVAVFGLASTLLATHAAGPFVAIAAHAALLAWALPVLLVGTPAFLMGGTLPAVVRTFIPIQPDAARSGAVFYAANTAGGIAGALLTSFVLIPQLGVRGSAFVAAALNLAASFCAIVLDRVLKPSPVGLVSKLRGGPRRETRMALALYAIAGGIALGYEVVWSQAMVQFMSTRVFAFSVVLAVYLLGLAVGGALWLRFAGRTRDAWGLFGFLIAAAGLVALLEVACLGEWQLRVQATVGDLVLAATGSEFARMCARFAVVAFGIVFVPTVLLGAAFPAALKLATRSGQVGREVGAVLALNTMGGIAGTLLTGFILIPAVGLVRTLGVLAIGAGAVGAAAVLMGVRTSSKMRGAVLLVCVLAAGAAILASSGRLASLLLKQRSGGELVFYQEGRGATVAVAEQQSGNHVFRRLYIQGVSNSGDAMPSLRYMRLQALLPLIIHRGEPKSALVIGFGTGITAGATLRYPGLETRVCLELLPAVVQAGGLFPENYKAGTDPRLKIRIGDGRQMLLLDPKRYDLITLEPPPPSAESIANLYSADFYRLAARRLERDGLFAQWLPLATQNEDDTKSLVQSFLDAFPYATLWTTELHESMLIGSLSPINLDMRQIAARFEMPEVHATLAAVGIPSAAALVSTWVTGHEGLERYAAGVRSVTDDDPRIEYATWVRASEITRTLPTLKALRTDPPVVGGDEAFRMEMNRQRRALWEFYAAGIAAYNGNRDEWSQSMDRVMAMDSKNPYYIWVAGGG